MKRKTFLNIALYFCIFEVTFWIPVNQMKFAIDHWVLENYYFFSTYNIVILILSPLLLVNALLYFALFAKAICKELKRKIKVK